jgi:hypothetical protein
MVNRFPLRLRSRDPSKEIRLGSSDVLFITDIQTIFGDISKAQEFNLKVPSILGQITMLGTFADVKGWSGFCDFSLLFDDVNAFSRCIPIFTALHTFVLGCEDTTTAQEGGDLFSGYTTEFDPFEFDTKNTDRQLLHDVAIIVKDSYVQSMKKFKHNKKNRAIKFPEMKIMARGWS